MRPGCRSGCLTTLLVMALASGTLWATAGLFQAPDVPLVVAGHEDWVTAQQKIFGLLRRSRPRPGQGQTVALSERELTAVVSRQLSESPALPLSGVSVRVMASGMAEIVGQVPLRAIARELPLAPGFDWLPERWTRRPVWVVVRLRPRLEGKAGAGRYLVLDVERFSIGRRRVPSMLLRLLLPTAALRHFSVPLPESVGGVTLERGRLLLSVAPSPARTEAEDRR